MFIRKLALYPQLFKKWLQELLFDICPKKSSFLPLNNSVIGKSDKKVTFLFLLDKWDNLQFSKPYPKWIKIADFSDRNHLWGLSDNGSQFQSSGQSAFLLQETRALHEITWGCWKRGLSGKDWKGQANGIVRKSEKKKQMIEIRSPKLDESREN